MSQVSRGAAEQDDTPGAIAISARLETAISARLDVRLNALLHKCVDLMFVAAAADDLHGMREVREQQRERERERERDEKRERGESEREAQRERESQQRNSIRHSPLLP